MEPQRTILSTKGNLVSLNDRCREALDALDAGVVITDTPAVRRFIRDALIEGAEGIRFPYGLRDVAREIRDAAGPVGDVPGFEGFSQSTDLDEYESRTDAST